MPAPPADLRAALVQELYDNGSLHDSRVAAAFRTVPRHVFLPHLAPAAAYHDEAIPTKYAPDGTHPISSSSQPSIMAIMLEQLDVQPGQRLLEIGAGTGYNAALLAYLTGPTGHVTTLDLDDDIVAAAREHLAAAGYGQVEAVTADGALGWPPGAPYDAIILTVGAWDIAPAWFTQLRPGGRLVLPLEVAPGGQKSAALVKPTSPEPSGRWFISESLRDCGFMTLRGALAHPEIYLPLDVESNLTVISDVPIPASAEAIAAWLRAGSHVSPTGISVTRQDLFGSVIGWLGLQAPDVATLLASGAALRDSAATYIAEYGRAAHRTRLTKGLFGIAGGCLLGHGPGEAPSADDHAPFALWLWSYGPHPEPARARLLEILKQWESTGGVGRHGQILEVFDRAAPPPALPAAGVIIEKPATRLRLTYAPPAR